MSVAEFVQTILEDERLKPQITAHRLLEGRPASYAKTHRPWPKAILDLLDKEHLSLYAHQALATDHIRAGHNVVISTPTASGKSLIYNLPVLEQSLMDPEAHALYLFPLKALAQDQLLTFNELCEHWPKDRRPTAALYDGDTPEGERKALRKKPPTVLITNPEMLHLAILPWHSQWSTFLAGLRLIVVDEAHTYRGVFGSNMAQVFRRLNRLVARYTQNPVYILCTATVGNPLELSVNLLGASGEQKPVVIEKSGAPQGPRHYIFIDPLLSPSTTAIDLLKTALSHHLRTIVYCCSRKMTELISIWAQHSCPPDLKGRISSYRSGFLPEERRKIEAQMASGELACVISTSALELGIDIGGLDVCILVGYPGTIMSTMQRGGRVGRANQESAVILLAGEDALDQYFIHHPDDFFSRPAEKAVLNPNNEIICARHLECAAQELPLAISEPWLRQKGPQKAINELLEQNHLFYSADGQFLLTNRKNPQREISLRSGGQTLSLETEQGQLIGSIDSVRALHEAHEGAIYLHHGRTYLITHFDQARGRIVAKEEKVPWYTRSRSTKTTVILEEEARKGLGRVAVFRGRLRITEIVTGYEKRSNQGNHLLSLMPLAAPPIIFETEGLWYVIPEELRITLENEFIHFMGSIHAMEHAMIGLLPLTVMADRNDFGGISTTLHPQVGLSTIFIYDGVPGGAGLTREAFEQAKAVLAQTFEVIKNCPCETGCPSCVHSPKCGSGNRPISKEGAILLLNELLKEGHEGDELAKNLVFSAPDAFAENLCLAEKPKDLPEANPCKQPLNQALAPPPLANYKPKSPPANYLVFDVETRRSAKEVGGWDHAELMGVSVTVAYSSLTNSYLHFTQEQLPELFNLFAKADLIIGFNSLRFDYSVLKPFTTLNLQSLPSLDLLQVLKKTLNYRLPLNNLAKATLGAPKSADGLKALSWWKEGKIAEIAKYCEDDVRLTRDLYLYGLKNGYLLFTNKAGQVVRLPVDFSLSQNQQN
ncbi:MAG: DEAD/DEAH box helicase [Desulfovibrio sp.]|nr:DEAD/DEAH box helicase [Desulfovibrio sp.]